jgi:hypothetical protein
MSQHRTEGEPGAPEARRVITDIERAAAATF